MRGRSATPQRVGQRLRSRTLLTPRYLCPRDREDAHHAGQGASAGAQVHMHAPGSWPCTLVDIPPPAPTTPKNLNPPASTSSIPFHPASLSALSLIFLYHRSPHAVCTRQGLTLAGKKLEAILMEQQDHRVFAAHSSLGWFAGERGRFEITKPFLECKNAVPTTEPQTLKGTQAAEKFAVVLPRKAPSVIKTKPPPAQKLAKAKAPAPPKTLEKSWQPWRSTVSVKMAAFLLVALVVMTCAAFGMVDATSLASARGAQSVLHANITGDLDMASSCNPAGIYFDPLSDMADAQSSVLPSSIELLHCEAVMHCNTAGLMPAVHAKMLPPSALGLSGFRHSDWHQNATEGMPCCPKSLPCMHYLKLLPVPTTSSNLQLGLHGSSMSSSLATVEEAKLLAGSADFGSRLNESASLAEQVAATIAAPSPSHLCISAPVHHCTSTRHLPPPPARCT